jgi:hypothetical protein
MRWGTYGLERNYVQGFCGLTWRKEPHGWPRHIWQDNTTMHLKETGWQVVGWIHMAQHRYMWGAFAKSAMNLRVTQNAGSFFTVYGTTSFLRKTPLHKVRYGWTILAVYWKGTNKLPSETFWMCINNHIYFMANHSSWIILLPSRTSTDHPRNPNQRPLAWQSIS